MKLGLVLGRLAAMILKLSVTALKHAARARPREACSYGIEACS